MPDPTNPTNNNFLNSSPNSTGPSGPVADPTVTQGTSTQSSLNDDQQMTQNPKSEENLVSNDTLVQRGTNISESEVLTSDSNEPPPPESVVTAPHAPKKYGGKKVIATIFGILLLVGAVSAGVYLVQRQQELREQAASGSECSHSQDCVLLDNPGNQGEYQAPRTISNVKITDQDIHEYGPGHNDDGCREVVISSSYLSWNKYGSGSSCKDVSNVQIWMGGTPEPTVTSVPTQQPSVQPSVQPTQVPGVSPTAIPSTNPSLQPTNAPGVTAECSEVKAYSTTWNLLTSDDLKSLSAGDKVRFTVSGTTNNGSFDKARFTINGSLKSEVTTKKPSTDEYYYEYTVPTATTTFNVKGELHHSSLGWF